MANLHFLKQLFIGEQALNSDSCTRGEPLPLRLLYGLMWFFSYPIRFVHFMKKLLGYKKKQMAHLRIDAGTYCSIGESISTLDEEWEAIAQGEPTLQKTHLELLQKSNPEGISNLYVKVYQEDKGAVALLYLQLVNGSGLQIKETSGYLQKLQVFFAKTHLNLFPMMVVGHVFRYNTKNFVFDSHKIGESEAMNLYNATLKRLENFYLPTAILIKDIEDDFAEKLENSNAEWHKIDSDFGMAMTIRENWNSIEDYKNELESSHRSNFNRKRKKMAGIVLRELTTEEIISEKYNIWQLYHNILRNQPYGVGVMPADYLLELRGYYGQQFKIFGFYKGKNIVAFTSAFLFDNTDICQIYYVGMDYTQSKEHDLYFNMLYHSIEVAIYHKRRNLVLGRTAYDPKARLGGIPYPMNTFYKVDNPIIRKFIQNFSEKNEERKEYNVFRQTSSANSLI